MGERKLKEVGNVTHYFTKIGVAVIDLHEPLSVGDQILIKGMTTNVEQTVSSMQIEHKTVDKAKAGQSIGLRVDDRVREGDTIYQVLQ